MVAPFTSVTICCGVRACLWPLPTFEWVREWPWWCLFAWIMVVFEVFFFALLWFFILEALRCCRRGELWMRVADEPFLPAGDLLLLFLLEVLFWALEYKTVWWWECCWCCFALLWTRELLGAAEVCLAVWGTLSPDDFLFRLASLSFFFRLRQQQHQMTVKHRPAIKQKKMTQPMMK